MALGDPNSDAAIEKDAVATFEAALSGGDGHKVKVWSSPRPGSSTWPYHGARDLVGNDYDEVIEALRQEFPKGGTYRLALINAKGKTIANGLVELAPVPVSQRTSREREPTRDLTTDPLIIMMQENARRSEEFTKLVVTSIVSIATVAIPLIIKKEVPPAADPLQLLNGLLDARRKINEETGGDDFDKTLDRMAKLQQAMPDRGGGGEGGLMGMFNNAMPLLAMMAQQNQGQSPGAVQPAATIQPQIPYAAPPVQSGQSSPPVVNQAAEPPETMDQTQQLIALYGPIIAAVKRLVEKDREPDSIVGYLEDQIDTGAFDEQAIEMLVNSVQAEPAMLAPVLAQFGVTDPKHVEVIREAVAIYADNMANREQEAREGGDGTVPEDHGKKRAG